MDKHDVLNQRTVKIFGDAGQLNRFAAEKVIEIAAEAIEKYNRCTLALAGGSTPKSLYRLLGADEFKNKIDWSKVFFFFGDERNVTPDNEESNFRMAKENLFAPLKIADENIFRWRTEIKDAEIIAGNYELAIWKYFEDKEESVVTNGDLDFPRFDLILLGLGADGHTASLFPFTNALSETKKIAVANPVEKLDTTRLTLTLPVINNAANVIFLVKGADKAAILQTVLEGEFQPEKFPAQSVKPENGKLFWLVDDEAAALLDC